jgi:hypothetical protein
MQVDTKKIIGIGLESTWGRTNSRDRGKSSLIKDGYKAKTSEPWNSGRDGKDRARYS